MACTCIDLHPFTDRFQIVVAAGLGRFPSGRWMAPSSVYCDHGGSNLLSVILKSGLAFSPLYFGKLLAQGSDCGGTELTREARFVYKRRGGCLVAALSAAVGMAFSIPLPWCDFDRFCMLSRAFDAAPQMGCRAHCKIFTKG